MQLILMPKPKDYSKKTLLEFFRSEYTSELSKLILIKKTKHPR